MTTISIIGAIVMFGIQLWGDYLKKAPTRKAKRDAMATVEVDELDAGMDRVDRHGVSHS